MQLFSAVNAVNGHLFAACKLLSIGYCLCCPPPPLFFTTTVAAHDGMRDAQHSLNIVEQTIYFLPKNKFIRRRPRTEPVKSVWSRFMKNRRRSGQKSTKTKQMSIVFQFKRISRDRTHQYVSEGCIPSFAAAANQ